MISILMKKAEHGQILLVVVLAMIVALTVGLSVASRTITNLKISRQNEESQRAFQAAEAGIEQTLQTGGTGATKELSNAAKYSTTVETFGGTEFLLSGGELVEQDVGIDIWIAEHPDYDNPKTGQITLYWGTSNHTQDCSDTTSSDAVKPAIEVFILSGSTTSPSVTKSVYDPCGGRTAGSITPAAGEIVKDITFNYSSTFAFTDGLIARVIPVYNSTKAAVTSVLNLPSQGQIIESEGTSGDTIRKVQYFSSHPQIPLEILPYSIISQ